MCTSAQEASTSETQACWSTEGRKATKRKSKRYLPGRQREHVWKHPRNGGTIPRNLPCKQNWIRLQS